MANSAVDTPRPSALTHLWGAGRRRSPGEPAPAPYGAALALTVTLATAGFLFLMSAVWVVHPPARLPGFLAAGGDQNQHTKTALYLCAFVAILPLAMFLASRFVDAVAGGPNGRALDALVAILAGSLAATILLVRLSGVVAGGGGTHVMLPLVAAWGLGAVALLARSASVRPFAPLLAAARHSSQLALAAGALAFGLVLSVTALHSISLLPLCLGLVVAACLVWLRLRGRAIPRLAGRRGAAVDALAAVLLFLAVPNLLIFTTGQGIPSWLTKPGIVQLHQDFLLGPANQLLHGGTLLVDQPVSQYGVGSVYFLTAWFHLVPIGYGTYGFLDGLLTALYYVAGLAVLRVAGVRRPLAFAAMAVAVIALVYNLNFPPGAIPQQGPIRFGLPMVVVLASVLAARSQRHARLFQAISLAAVGVAAIWALEAFAYTVVTYAAVACVEGALLPEGRRMRGALAGLVRGALAVVGAHVLFALITLAASGSLPHWGQYSAFVNAFLFGGAPGSITYGFSRWSPGVAVGGLYLASAAAIVLLLIRRPEFARRERLALVALTGTTAHGVALFSYFDNRSATFLLLYVALPALLTATLWLTLVMRPSVQLSRGARAGALAFALCLGVLLVSTAWPSIGGSFARTPVAEAFPGGHGLAADLRRLWHAPPIDPRAPAGERLLARYMPGQKHVLIVVSPDLGTEILLRSKRANALPVGDPIEESFVTGQRLPLLEKDIAKLPAGQRVLLDANTWAMLQTIRAHPAADPLKEFYGSLQTPLQGWILQQLDRRFRIEPIVRDPSGFIVARLSPRG